MDTIVENFINVHVKEGKGIKFKEVNTGIYLTSRNNSNNDRKFSAYSYLTLVSANKTEFTKRQVERSDGARDFRRRLGYPRYKRFFKLLGLSYFINCPINIDDTKRALYTYRLDIKTLREKTTRRKPMPINDIVETGIPSTILELHLIINLLVNYFFVQGVAFLHSIARGYSFRTVEHLKKCKKSTIK